MAITAAEIKSLAGALGADLCGIAAAEQFAGAPAGFHPADVLPGAKAVVVVAVRFPAGPLDAATTAPYMLVHNRLSARVDDLTCALAAHIEKRGATAVPVPATAPYDSWDAAERRGQGIISLKHAAVRAGLGKLGKNTLLVNERLGNLLLLGAVLTDAGLPSDPPAAYDVCPPGCRLCLDSCPAQAMDGVTVAQKKCRPRSIRASEGGGALYACNTCRKICPNRQGLKQAKI